MGDSYISDLAPRSFGDKDGMVQFKKNQPQYGSLLHMEKKHTRLSYASMTDVEVFLEALKKVKIIDPRDHDATKNIDTETFNSMEDLAKNIDLKYPNTIKYRSPIGLVYGNEFLNIINYVSNKLERDRKIKNLFDRGEKAGISPFDIVRYYRYIQHVISI